MTGEPRYRRRSSTRFRKVFEEGLLLDQEVARLHVLNPAAAFLWERLASPCSAGELAAALAAEFDVDEATARRDVEEFLEQALAAGVLERSDPPSR